MELALICSLQKIQISFRSDLFQKYKPDRIINNLFIITLLFQSTVGNFAESDMSGISTLLDLMSFILCNRIFPISNDTDFVNFISNLLYLFYRITKCIFKTSAES